MGNKQVRLDDEARNILSNFGGQANSAVKDLHRRYNILNSRVAELENQISQNKTLCKCDAAAIISGVKVEFESVLEDLKNSRF